MSKQKIEISSNNFCGCFGETILWNLSRSRWILHIHIFITVHVNWKVGEKKIEKKNCRRKNIFQFNRLFVSYGLLLSDPSVVASSGPLFVCIEFCALGKRQKHRVCVALFFQFFIRFVNFIFIILCTKCKIIFLRHSSSALCVWMCRVYSLRAYVLL